MPNVNHHHDRRPATLVAGRLIGVLLLALLAGCGGRKPPPVPDAAEARDALKSALDAWQQGKPIDSLAKQRPPMLVNDFEWAERKVLLGYELQGEGEMFGPTFRCQVLLVLEGTPGQPVKRQVTYQVATSPKISVVREFE